MTETKSAEHTDLQGRAATHRYPHPVEWILVEGDRNLIAAAISLGLFGLLLGLEQLGLIAFVNDDSITRLAGGMIAGMFSLVTLVVSINQLILSREFRSAGEVRGQLQDVATFREDVAAAAGIPTAPIEPSRFLGTIVRDIESHANALTDALGSHPPVVRDRTGLYAEYVDAETGAVAEALERDRLGMFEAVSACIEYDDSWQLYAGHYLREEYADDLTESAAAELDAILEGLERFNIAIEHFKTTYLQRELTRFSQLTIVYGVPAVVAAMVLGFSYGAVDGAVLNLAVMPYVASALTSIVVFPLALLAAYVLRTATITRRTAAVSPMVPAKNQTDEPFANEPGIET